MIRFKNIVQKFDLRDFECAAAVNESWITLAYSMPVRLAPPLLISDRLGTLLVAIAHSKNPQRRRQILSLGTYESKGLTVLAYGLLNVSPATFQFDVSFGQPPRVSIWLLSCSHQLCDQQCEFSHPTVERGVVDSDPGRANILTALMGGKSLAATELSQEPGIDPQWAFANASQTRMSQIYLSSK